MPRASCSRAGLCANAAAPATTRATTIANRLSIIVCIFTSLPDSPLYSTQRTPRTQRELSPFVSSVSSTRCSDLQRRGRGYLRRVLGDPFHARDQVIDLARHVVDVRRRPAGVQVSGRHRADVDAIVVPDRLLDVGHRNVADGERGQARGELRIVGGPQLDTGNLLEPVA